jgi:uncharacterized protein YkwD
MRLLPRFACLLVIAVAVAALPPSGAQQPPPKKDAKKGKATTAEQLLKDPQVKKALDRLNELRKVAGVNPVTLDVDLSEGCRKHSEYVAFNLDSPHVAGLKAHDEKSDLKGASPEGAKAGKASVIHYIPPAIAVDGWIATFYHRIPLIQPGVKRVGIGYATRGDRVVVCLDSKRGFDPGVRPEGIVVYPTAGQKGVPLAFGGGVGVGEDPDPLPKGAPPSAGYPVSVTFFGNAKVTKAVLTLTGKDFNGKKVAVAGYLSTPEKPASDFSQWNTVCLIPKEPLAEGTLYTAELTVEVDGKPVKKTWSFTTQR